MAAAGGRRTAICSGIDNYDGVIEEESHLTTPEIMELYQHMNNALNSGIRYMTMEVSSQALKYDRVDGVTFEAGAFLNIGTDHISEIEHPDFNDYLESKLRIFAQCRKAAINLDCDEQERIRAAAEACPYVIAFSQKDDTANIYGYDVKSVEGKVSMRVRCMDVEGWNDFDEEFTLGTFGTINVENANEQYIGTFELTPTSIEEKYHEQSTKNNDVYDLQGRRVIDSSSERGGARRAEGSLPKGLYIKGGRKFLKR